MLVLSAQHLGFRFVDLREQRFESVKLRMSFKVRVSRQEYSLIVLSTMRIILDTINCSLDGKSLVFKLKGTLLTVIEVFSFDINVKASLDILVILACSRDFPIDTSALSSTPGIIVSEGMCGVILRSKCFSRHAACRGAVDIVDVELILLVLLGVLVDEAASLGGGLQVVAHEEVVKLSEWLIQLDLHLTNITV